MTSRFPLSVTTLPSGEPRPDLRTNRGEGVELGADGISWVCQDRQQARAYGDIRSITLEWEGGGSDAGRDDVAFCTIAFCDGLRLIVSSGPGLFRWLGRIRGTPRSTAMPPYREFVAELHQQLEPRERSRIAFHFGQQPYPLGLRLAFHALWAGSTVAVPAILAITIEAPGLLLVSAIGGAVTIYAELAMTRAPRPYSPDAVPRSALPP